MPAWILETAATSVIAPGHAYSVPIRECARAIHNARRALCAALTTAGGPPWQELGLDRQRILCAMVEQQADHPQTRPDQLYLLFIELASRAGLRCHITWEGLAGPLRAEYALFAPLVAAMVGE
jgi:hypothetical protein